MSALALSLAAASADSLASSLSCSPTGTGQIYDRTIYKTARCCTNNGGGKTRAVWGSGDVSIARERLGASRNAWEHWLSGSIRKHLEARGSVWERMGGGRGGGHHRLTVLLMRSRIGLEITHWSGQAQPNLALHLTSTISRATGALDCLKAQL